MPTMLILGARSDIARATALAFADNGWDICLAGRDVESLQKDATDIAIRTEKQVNCVFFDAIQIEEHSVLWNSLAENIDGLLCAVGMLGDQEQARHDMALAQAILKTNFTSLVPMLSLAADTFEQRGNGLIIGISSVAGERGRASNYIYGSAKAGLIAVLSGLRQRLAARGVEVLTVLPGFVSTKMTDGMDLPTCLTATPEQVAADIVRAVKKKKSIVYTRWYWKWIMLVIKAIPEKIFQKLKKL